MPMFKSEPVDRLLYRKELQIKIVLKVRTILFTHNISPLVLDFFVSNVPETEFGV